MVVHLWLENILVHRTSKAAVPVLQLTVDIMTSKGRQSLPVPVPFITQRAQKVRQPVKQQHLAFNLFKIMLYSLLLILSGGVQKSDPEVCGRRPSPEECNNLSN